MSILRLLTQKYGPYKGPTATGFYNFCHPACGDRRHRFGINVKSRRWLCWNCGKRGWLTDLVPSAELLGADVALPRPSRARAPEKKNAAGVSLPWRPITHEGPTRALEEDVLGYLEHRGVTRRRAADLRLGYGVASRWFGCVIHPWYGDHGRLAGWQARVTGDPDVGPKVITATADDLPVAEDYQAPRKGGLYLLDRIVAGTPALVAEGPYDAISALRVVPAVALLGSRLHEAQLRRLLRRRPSSIYIAVDRDKTVRWYDQQERAWQPPAQITMARQVLRAGYTGDVLLVEYPDDFSGDLGGLPDKTPHPRGEIERLVLGARPFRLGM
jgi:hypothetical protein